MTVTDSFPCSLWYLRTWRVRALPRPHLWYSGMTASQRKWPSVVLLSSCQASAVATYFSPCLIKKNASSLNNGLDTYLKWTDHQKKKKHYWKLDRIEIARGGESQKPSKVWRSGGGRGGEGRRGEFQKPPWVYMDIFQNNTFCMTEKEDGLPAISATAFCSNFAWTRQRQQKQQEVTYFSTNLSVLQLEWKSPNAFLTTTT